MARADNPTQRSFDQKQHLGLGSISLFYSEHCLLMIKVPAVYNYQFDKFTSSLLIIIISFHSVQRQGMAVALTMGEGWF